jgi:hypothetical protein
LLDTLGGVLPFHPKRGIMGQSFQLAKKMIDDSKKHESDVDEAKVNKTTEQGADKGGKKEYNIERPIVGSDPEAKKQRALQGSASIGIPEECICQFP